MLGFVFGQLIFKVLHSFLSLVPKSVEILVLGLFLAQSVFFKSLKFSFFLLQFVLFHDYFDVHFVLDISLSFEESLLASLELLISLLQLRLNHFTYIYCSALKTVKN